MKKKFCLLLAAICLLLSGCSAKMPEAEAPELLEPVGVELDYAEAQVMDLYTITPYSGSVVPHVEELSFTVDGTIAEVHAALGSLVKAGDALITLDEESLIEQEAELSAQLEYTRSIHKNANETANIDIRIAQIRLDEMQKNGADAAALSQAQADIDMKTLLLRQNMTEQEAEIAALEADLAALREKIGRNVLTAPYDGVIVAIDDLREGYSVQAYETVVQIADESRIHIRCDFVSENNVKGASEIYALIGDGRYDVEYQPIDMEEYLTAVFSGAALRSDFAFADAPEGVSCGDFAAVCLMTGLTPDALAIPVNALYTDETGRYVYRLEEDGQRVRVNVHTGASNSLHIQITEGLEEGDMVYVKE